ncbi:YtcA family lipoprotein [Paraburkholderia sp. JHI869]|uniref:YtcA family lipoprotein n=1 Tax=Paraburkholderia sp. JHI869 TaxID=3112959 RepID=UPI00319D8AF3
MPPGSTIHSRRAVCMACAASLLLQGCAVSPSIAVVGAYFPGWLFCIVAGVVLAILTFLALKRVSHDRLLGPPALVYPTLVTFFSLIAWLIFFQH